MCNCVTGLSRSGNRACKAGSGLNGIGRWVHKSRTGVAKALAGGCWCRGGVSKDQTGVWTNGPGGNNSTTGGE